MMAYSLLGTLTKTDTVFVVNDFDACVIRRAPRPRYIERLLWSMAARTSRTGAAWGMCVDVHGLHSTVSCCSLGTFVGLIPTETQHTSGWSDTCSQRRRLPVPSST